MNKLVFVVVFALALSGCAAINSVKTLTGASVTPSEVYVAGNTFVALEATATQYLNLSYCPSASKVCKTQEGVNAIVPAIRAARAAVSAMENYASANPGSVVPVSLYTTATTSISALQTALTQYNIQAEKSAS